MTTAALALLAGVAGAAITGFVQLNSEQTKTDSALKLEQLKFESNLILRALESGNPVQTLKFFADAGLIPNHSEAVLKLPPSAIPNLAAEKKIKLYRETNEIVDRLATLSIPITEQFPEYVRFWELYRRDLIGIESNEVAQKMIAIGYELKPFAKDNSLPTDQLNQLSKDLREQIQKELADVESSSASQDSHSDN